MEMKIQIPFQQLLTVVKTLPPAQKARLRKELDQDPPIAQTKNDFIDLLLHGPVYSDADLKIIDDNSKSIAAWRTKS